MTREDLLEAMRNCEQTPGMTILQHGEMVRDYYTDLIGPRHFEWRTPSWLGDRRLTSRLYDDDTMAEYQLFHDCGKPFCRTAEGHFPDHARVSRDLYLQAGGDYGISQLIAMDMDVHVLKGEWLQEFATRPQAASLLYTGLAEIHANAAMFGGLDSVSFKIKWKHLEKRGRQILGILSQEACMT